jgi:hypothetical protein
MKMIKTAGLRYSDTPYGTSGNPGPPRGIDFSDIPRKGQKNNPLRTMNIPRENKQYLSKRNSRSIARSMARAGGPTSAEGATFSAVLQERGINPNLAQERSTMGLSKVIHNDLYKAAMYSGFTDEIEKLAAEDGTADPNSMPTESRYATDWPIIGMAAAVPALAYGGYKLWPHGQNALSKVTGGLVSKSSIPTNYGASKFWMPLGLSAAGTYLAYDTYKGINDNRVDVLNVGLNNTNNKSI